MQSVDRPRVPAPHGSRVRPGRPPVPRAMRGAETGSRRVAPELAPMLAASVPAGPLQAAHARLRQGVRPVRAVAPRPVTRVRQVRAVVVSGLSVMRVGRQDLLAVAELRGESAVLRGGQTELVRIGPVRIERIADSRHDRDAGPMMTGVRLGRRGASARKRRCATRCRRLISPC